MPALFAEPTVEAALQAAHSSQEALNIFTHIDDSGAMERAGILADPDFPGSQEPLHGVPIGLKDLIDHEGRITTCGSAFYREEARSTAPVVDRLESAGAVVIGRTGLHEWAFGFSSENPHFGPVRNPWDPTTSTGGSSGGTAAAVAAGITPMGVGTDTGGSIRVPAALCGCFGLKPTYGRIPKVGVFPLVASVDTVGPLADSAARLETGYRVMAADDDPTPQPPVRIRFAVPQEWVDQAPGMSDVVRTGFDDTIDALHRLGHEVEPVKAPYLVPPGLSWEAIAEEVTAVHRHFRMEGKPYGDDVAARLDAAAEVTPASAARAREWQEEIRGRFRELFADFDFVATPTVPVTRKLIGVEDIEGHHYRTVVSWFTALVNQSLHPAVAMPLTETGDPPVSLQLIGNLGSELSLLSIASHLETAGIVGFRPAPPASPNRGDG